MLYLWKNRYDHCTLAFITIIAIKKGATFMEQVGEKGIEKSNSMIFTFSHYIVKCEKVVIFLTALFVSFAMFVQVLLRYVFDYPLFGIEEISVLVCSWLYFMGIAYSVQTESYISVDVLFLFVKKQKVRKWCRILSLFVSLLTSCILFFYALKYGIWMSKSHVLTPVFLISQNFGFSATIVGSFFVSVHFIELLLREFKK